MKNLFLIAFLVTIATGCPPAYCPDGYLRDNDGNCLQVGDDDDASDDDDAGEDDDDAVQDDDDDTTPESETCSLIISISSGCTYCAPDGIRFDTVENEGEDDHLSGLGSNNNMMPGQSDGGSIAAGVVTIEWHLIGGHPTFPDECWQQPEDYGMWWADDSNGIPRVYGADSIYCPADGAVEYHIVCDPG